MPSRKGSPNNRTIEMIVYVNKRLIAAGLKGNYNPVAELALIACDETNDINLRYQCHKECAQYFFPKRKAIEVEHSGNIHTNASELSDDELADIARSGSSGTSEKA
jgi:hypothetical protein